MLKRLIDVSISFLALILVVPCLLCISILIWMQDFNNPLYIAPRVGKNKKLFNIIKLRTMVVAADKTGVTSSGSDDKRVTSLGKWIRRFKLDELTQLINILKGEMSLVGPRPNVLSQTQLYTREEQELFIVEPGITDFSSIIFSDEGEILKGYIDTDLAYNQLIRPWKSKLGLFYIKHQTVWLDFKLMLYTLICLFNRSLSLQLVSNELKNLGAPTELIQIAKREGHLLPLPPIGADTIFLSK